MRLFISIIPTTEAGTRRRSRGGRRCVLNGENRTSHTPQNNGDVGWVREERASYLHLPPTPLTCGKDVNAEREICDGMGEDARPQTLGIVQKCRIGDSSHHTGKPQIVLQPE